MLHLVGVMSRSALTKVKVAGNLKGTSSPTLWYVCVCVCGCVCERENE